ncbi:hypothetical protein Shyhy01_03140 [Streptomyces hygroscopicus subsp. hygroscopicus]|nr:hypothetical protein Shyhy01_03140 [Streptomyces hygroscopicus subsp. hygroscopicus]
MWSDTFVLMEGPPRWGTKPTIRSALTESPAEKPENLRERTGARCFRDARRGSYGGWGGARAGARAGFGPGSGRGASGVAPAFAAGS